MKYEPIEVVTVNRRGEITQRQQRFAKYFVEDLGNRINLEMAAIPGGTFIMGTPEAEKLDGIVRDKSQPQHQVSVKPFYIGKFTVTQAQWKAVAKLPKIEQDLDPDPSYFKGYNNPVEKVSWYDAVEFCTRLLKATGKEYRLPSEAEWEYACRARTTTPFYYGETITSDLANYKATNSYADEPLGEYREKNTPVGLFPPNVFGLYDMHGNVLEWCQDSWHENYNGAPTDGTAWIDNNDYYINYYHRHHNAMRSLYDSRILRGGSRRHNPYTCRSANRFAGVRGESASSRGFRIACDIF
ncbi:MAG: formylglycine-generating enzyme family protein [Rivularia sp. (in: cyanobacteria)]